MRLNRLMLQMITLIALSIYLGLASWSLAFAGPCEGDVPSILSRRRGSQADITVPATERTAVCHHPARCSFRNYRKLSTKHIRIAEKIFSCSASACRLEPLSFSV